jgi:peptidoglycan hydrolase-like protein with peptidoglycan-binding domain
LGLKDYFFNMKEDSSMRTAALPYDWNKTISEALTQGPDIYALQIALRQMGFYPIERKTLSDCPISGFFGSCTQKALTAFQTKYKIKDEEGVLGEVTREKLNDLGK